MPLEPSLSTLAWDEAFEGWCPAKKKKKHHPNNLRGHCPHFVENNRHSSGIPPPLLRLTPKVSQLLAAQVVSMVNAGAGDIMSCLCLEENYITTLSTNPNTPDCFLAQVIACQTLVPVVVEGV